MSAISKDTTLTGVGERLGRALLDTASGREVGHSSGSIESAVKGKSQSAKRSFALRKGKGNATHHDRLLSASQVMAPSEQAAQVEATSGEEGSAGARRRGEEMVLTSRSVGPARAAVETRALPQVSNGAAGDLSGRVAGESAEPGARSAGERVCEGQVSAETSTRA